MSTSALPQHPGQYLQAAFAAPLSLTASQLAFLLEVPNQDIEDLLALKSDLTPELAHRLAIVFNKKPEDWTGLQTAYGLARAKANEDLSGLAPYARLNEVWTTGVPTVAGNYLWREGPGEYEHRCKVSFVPYGDLIDRQILCYSTTEFSFVDDGRGQWRLA